MTAKHTPWLASAAVIGALATSGCAAVATPGASDTGSDVGTAVESAPHWSYDSADGPDHWGELSDEYGTCSAGALQSPIDLPAAVPAPSGSLTVDTDSVEGEVADTGHTMQFTVDDDASILRVSDVTAELLQVHVHTPSEHTIDGSRAAAEVHFVHADADGGLVVLGALVEEGVASEAWEPFVEAAGADGESEVELELSALLPADLTAYAYTGSLTTPPCSEDVRWLVLAAPLTFSAEQIATLHAVHDDNARPIQPLGERSIVGVTGRLE